MGLRPSGPPEEEGRKAGARCARFAGKDARVPGCDLLVLPGCLIGGDWRWNCSHAPCSHRGVLSLSAEFQDRQFHGPATETHCLACGWRPDVHATALYCAASIGRDVFAAEFAGIDPHASA